MGWLPGEAPGIFWDCMFLRDSGWCLSWLIPVVFSHTIFLPISTEYIFFKKVGSAFECVPCTFNGVILGPHRVETSLTMGRASPRAVVCE